MEQLSYKKCHYYSINQAFLRDFINVYATYFGNQLKSELDEGRQFGILGNTDFLLVATYEDGGANPELLLYKKDETRGNTGKTAGREIIKKAYRLVRFLLVLSAPVKRR
ncbi:MAG: hypothetical protein IKR59_08215 [Lachnospiraceae bacterium]|nr:hypothetical protein [Lachnospiraceae bacterium]